MKIGLAALQLVIFTDSLDLSDKLKLAQELKDIKSVKFDGEPTILPLPQDVPLELPRIMLKTKDGTYALNVSPIRTDIIFQERESIEGGIPKAQIKDIRKQITGITSEIFLILTKQFSANVSRAAVVTRQVIRLRESSGEFLQSTVFRKMKDKPYEIRSGFLFREKIDKFQINKWLNLQTLRSKKDSRDDSALGLAFDINTLSDIDYKFTNEEILKFYNASLDKIAKEVEEFISQRKEKL